MLDQRTRPDSPAPDRSLRSAALVAAAVAVPVAVLVAVVIFSHLRDRTTAAAPAPSATATPAVLASGPVRVPARSLPARAETVCRAMISQLPAAVRGMPQRPVTAGAEQNAAYGDPAITVACGTAAPTVPAESLLMTMDRVCWFTQQRTDATVWTAIDRQVPVQVSVPARYDAPAQWANEFSATIMAAVPSIKDVPSGCG